MDHQLDNQAPDIRSGHVIASCTIVVLHTDIPSVQSNSNGVSGHLF